MMNAVESLTIPDLQSKLLEKETEVFHLNVQVSDLSVQVAYLNEQLEWFKRQIFGKRSEKIVSNVNSEQLLFEGFEEIDKDPPLTKTIPEHKRKQPNKNGKDTIKLPSDLPVETTVLDIPEEEKVCKETGIPLICIGEEKSYKLAHKPGSFYLKEIIRPKYVHPEKEELGIFNAPLPDSLLPRCRADESLLAEIAVNKFGDHLPLYRISEILSRNRIEISRRLLSQWMVSMGHSLKPLFLVMKEKILESKNIFIDETPVKMQNGSLSYIWTVVGGPSSDPPDRFYDFKENRRHDNVEKILGDYQGVFHSDKYGAYESFAQREGVIWSPCFTHIRRKFFEAQAGDQDFREWILEQIGKLFGLEELAWQLTEEERLLLRQTQAAPLIDEMIKRVKDKLIHGKILPKSKFKEALGYFCSLIPYLKNYTLHANARLDNNVAERAIRPIAIGRKNWLFFGSKESGESGSILLSLIQTCRGLNINPREYLEDISKKIMGHTAQKLHELLPDEWLKTRQAFIRQ